jgi:hypothetical protein
MISISAGIAIEFRFAIENRAGCRERAPIELVFALDVGQAPFLE